MRAFFPNCNQNLTITYTKNETRAEWKSTYLTVVGSSKTPVNVTQISTDPCVSFPIKKALVNCTVATWKMN